ncbi:autotransporter domain-containing protein [uncultured Cohaesibacter sp.]|uniref:autotransporter outer membrane beta-barrel domain-containing protein n=1 Tax=uncultured Cohaesibacter sp. TaxID=1002546 RepID=UPI0029C7EA74|nr:autotransporter domain-containing protein [uncultured Cohaesibacter sp.]
MSTLSFRRPLSADKRRRHVTSRLLASTAICATVLFVVAGSDVAMAVSPTYTVTKSSDDGTGTTGGTLSWAILQATSDGDVIDIDASVSTITITGTLPSASANISITTDHAVEVIGSALGGAGSTSLTLNGASSAAALKATLSGTLQGDDATSDGGSGSSALSGAGFIVNGNSDIAGGNARDGASGSYDYYFGGIGQNGGAGGNGVDAYYFSLESSGHITGGTGGAGGTGGVGYFQAGNGGAGGAGGAGVYGYSFSLITTGTVTGGNGGDGGNGGYGSMAAGRGANGGVGGAGVSGSSFSLTNSGTITGGNGGVGGIDGRLADDGIHDGVDGAGGVGVTGFDITLVNSGTITGGLSGDGVTRANAIEFTSGTNSLELQSGYVINGNVVANGSSDTLILGGSNDTSFDLDEIGTQYTGFEAYSKTGSSTWTLTGTAGEVMGTFSVSGGTLAVNTTLTSLIDVLDGGTLGGTGTVSNVTLASGATIAPGNSIGTLTVDGDLIFVDGSTYEVEVDSDGTGDKLVSTGTITIDSGATLSIQSESGTDDGASYDTETVYTIISASTLSGTFDTITEDFAFLTANVSYSATEATLTLSQTQVFSDFAETPNQYKVALAIEGMSSNNALSQAVLALPNGEPASAFNQLTGEQYANMQSLLAVNSGIDRGAVGLRLRSAMGGIGGSGDQVSVGFHNEEDIPSSFTRTPQMWAQAFGMWGEVGATANTARTSSDEKGFLLGVDAELIEGWRAGVLGGYSHGSVSATSVNSSSEVDHYHMGLYGGTQWDALDGVIGLTLGANYIWHQVDAKRQVSFTGFSDSLSANYDASTAQLFAEIGYTYELDAARLQPFAGGAILHQWSDSFIESGGASKLSVDSTNEVLGMTSLGVRGDVTLDRSKDIETVLNGSLAWQHAVGDLETSTNMRFASGGDAFKISGSPIDRDTALIEAGLSFSRGSDLALGVSYRGEFGTNAKENGFRVGFKHWF